MALLDIQRRGQQLGRLRIGQLIPSSTPGKMRPVALDTFRFTTDTRHTADAIADLYGGNVVRWNNEWEVITGRDVIEVVVPPRDQVITQWYEMWSAAGCQRRCDSQREVKSGGPCLCPHAEDATDPEEVLAAALERDRLAKLNPPQACQRKTRINIAIPDLPGLGVFRLDTGSFYAAGQVLDIGDLMQAAREQNVLLPAMVRITKREEMVNGQKKKYVVPVLQILSTLREIASGALAAGGITAQLPPAPGQQPHALTAGTSPTAAPRAAVSPQHLADPQPLPSRPEDAQEVADLALNTTDVGLIDRLCRLTRFERWEDDMVLTGDEVMEELYSFLESRLEALSQPEDGAA